MTPKCFVHGNEVIFCSNEIISNEKHMISFTYNTTFVSNEIIFLIGLIIIKLNIYYYNIYHNILNIYLIYYYIGLLDIIFHVFSSTHVPLGALYQADFVINKLQRTDNFCVVDLYIYINRPIYTHSSIRYNSTQHLDVSVVYVGPISLHIHNK